MAIQTILGAGGAIGVELAKALPKYTNDIRLVSRKPEKVNPGDALHPADLLKPGEVQKAVEGSDTVYVAVGFPYNTRFWAANWPPFMRSVIDACGENNARLVFIDNIYMYDPNYLGAMDENTPINPASKKGKVRARIAQMIMDAVDNGKVKGLIARSADFYGPSIENTSVLTETVFNPLSNGKKANWIGSVKYRHSFTYTPDAGRAMALLGNTDDAYGQVWHLPTAADPPTGIEWIKMIAHELGKKPRYQVATKPVVRFIGLFNPVMRELVEMYYQNDRDYVFRSDKFEKRFELKPTAYLDGVREIIRSDYIEAPEKMSRI